MSESRLVYSSETPIRPVKKSALCEHGRDAGQTCYPCDDAMDADWLDRHYTGGPGEDLDFRTEEQIDADMERYLWFGTPDNPIL